MNNSVNCTFKQYSKPVSVAIAVYISIVLVLGIVLNATALWIFCCRMKKKWTEATVYMTNLAVADLCLLCSLPIFLYSRGQSQKEDTVLCQVSQSIYLVNRYMSISIVTMIAVDRYVAIKFPIRAKMLRSPRRSAIICALLWALVIISTLTSLIVQLRKGAFCFFNENSGGSQTNYLSLFTFFFPLGILTFCSVQVIMTLVRKRTTDAHEKKVIRKAIWIISANLLVFVVCFLPMHVALSFRLIVEPSTCSGKEIWKNIMFLTSRWSNTNCCLDAICYYFVAKEFQEASGQTSSTLSRSHKLQDSTQASLA